MIIAYLNVKPIESYQVTIDNQALLNKAIWIDLISPSREEELLVEKFIKAGIPTPEEMVEIEISSRLYNENGVLYMTATMLAQSESIDPKFDSISFVLTKKQLITIRYIEPQAFRLFTMQLHKLPPEKINAQSLLIELLDATVDRLADILELIGHHLDDYSKKIFRIGQASSEKPNYLSLMQQIGINGNLNAKARESLVTFSRLFQFLGQTINKKEKAEDHAHVVGLINDIVSLSDHADFLSNKITFLLDATLGMVGIEQNNVIKIFSVAAVMFLPPTLIASVFGMNFHRIPELAWQYGYYYAIVLMFFSSYIPYRYFKVKKWL